MLYLTSRDNPIVPATRVLEALPCLIKYVFILLRSLQILHSQFLPKWLKLILKLQLCFNNQIFNTCIVFENNTNGIVFNMELNFLMEKSEETCSFFARVNHPGKKKQIFFFIFIFIFVSVVFIFCTITSESGIRSLLCLLLLKLDKKCSLKKAQNQLPWTREELSVKGLVVPY